MSDRAFLQLLEQLLALGAVFLLDHRAARDDDVVALLVELDDLELERLAFEVARVAHRAHVDQRARQERADVLDVDGEAALDAAADAAGDDLAASSNASSRRVQVRARLAFSRDRRVSPEPSSTLSSATSTSSPTLTSISPRSFWNCSIGMTASDFRPALTTTTSGPTSTTRPVRIWPGRDALARQALFEQLRQNFRSCTTLSVGPTGPFPRRHPARAGLLMNAPGIPARRLINAPPAGCGHGFNAAAGDRAPTEREDPRRRRPRWRSPWSR